jgi:hypothetical protein
MWSLKPVPPMLATIASTLPVGRGWSYDVKWDGYGALLVKEGTRVRLLSPNLKDLTADYPHIAAAAATLTRHDAIIDGEIVALDEHGVPSCQALQHRSQARSRYPSAVEWANERQAATRAAAPKIADAGRAARVGGLQRLRQRLGARCTRVVVPPHLRFGQ